MMMYRLFSNLGKVFRAFVVASIIAFFICGLTIADIVIFSFWPPMGWFFTILTFFAILTLLRAFFDNRSAK